MKHRIEIKHLTGLFVGAASGKFVLEEVRVLAEYLRIKGVISNTDEVLFLGGFLALGAFAIICFLFSKYGKNGLGNYLLLSVVISFAVDIVMLLLTGLIMNIPVVQNTITKVMEQNGVLAVGVSYLVIVILVLIFVFTFRKLVKCKVGYIRYITSEIQQMKKEGFGRQMKVKYHDELAELSIGINAMSLALREKQEREKEQEEQKNRLIADISHDLRTPLTSIIGYTELLKQNGFQDEEKYKLYLEVIDRRLGNMKTMVDQLFEYTRLTQSDYHLNFQVIKINKLFSYIYFEYGSILKNMNYQWVMVTEFEDASIFVDQERFMRAMGNLLENAKKYSCPETQIRLEGKIVEEIVQIKLSNEVEHPDSIDPERIFERFYKVEQARLPESSTGLGLPIVKKIIQLHGGTVHVKIMNNRILFVIQMPLYKE